MIKNSSGTIVYQTDRDTVNLKSWMPPNGVIILGDTYTVYVRYEGSYGTLSEWSIARTFIGSGIPFGKYMAINHANNPYITIYGRDIDTFTKLPNPTSLPIGPTSSDDRTDIVFSSDGVYLVVIASLPRISIYKRTGDSFNLLSGPDVIPSSFVYKASFTNDNVYLAVSHNSSPYINIYKRSDDVFTKLANPSILPTGAGNAVSFYG